LVGYELSPVLWKKVKGGLSAGRVQSVSVRLIVEREREIQDFKPRSFLQLQPNFLTKLEKHLKQNCLRIFLLKKKLKIFLTKNIGSIYKVGDLETKPTKKSPAAPFTTSTLQQEAARKLYLACWNYHANCTTIV
jgi:DNA topoisomerase I